MMVVTNNNTWFRTAVGLGFANWRAQRRRWLEHSPVLYHKYPEGKLSWRSVRE